MVLATRTPSNRAPRHWLWQLLVFNEEQCKAPGDVYNNEECNWIDSWGEVTRNLIIVYMLGGSNSDIYGWVRTAATFVDEWGQQRYPANVARNPKPWCSSVVTTTSWCNIQRKPPRPSGIMVSCREAYAVFEENARARRQRGSNSCTIKSCHDGSIGRTGNCLYDNLWCYQWWQNLYQIKTLVTGSAEICNDIHWCLQWRQKWRHNQWARLWDKTQGIAVFDDTNILF